MGRLADLQSTTLRLITNFRGWKTRRRLLVIESDDWGAIRVPGPLAHEQLLKAGIPVDSSPYDRLDCLESRDDFQALMNVIDAHRDTDGRPATFTFNTVMGNPDFGAIERDGFERYHHQHLFESYRYYNGEDMKAEWRAAIKDKLIQPQFHGREHLNVPLWMRDLRDGYKETRIAFHNRFYGLRTKTSSKWQKHYKAAYNAESQTQLETIAEIASDGLRLFKKTFEFPSTTFVACNYVLPAELEKHLASCGIDMIQTQRGYLQPLLSREGQKRRRYCYTGKRNSFGQHYSVRNVLFEPYLDKSADWPSRALRQVSQAFSMGTPAILCSHRINYVSGMNKTHRDVSLRQLDKLLKKIRHRWPQVEFITSDQLAMLMRGSRT